MDLLLQALISLVVAGVFAWWVDRRGAHRLAHAGKLTHLQDQAALEAIEARFSGFGARLAKAERAIQRPRAALPPIKRRKVTATQGRRPTLMGGLSPRELSWTEKRSAQLIAQGVDPATARQQAEEEGRIANASP